MQSYLAREQTEQKQKFPSISPPLKFRFLHLHFSARLANILRQIHSGKNMSKMFLSFDAEECSKECWIMSQIDIKYVSFR